MVPREAHVFSGTVHDASAYGHPDTTDTEVEAAVRAVGAHEMVAGLRPSHLQPVAERGRNLSARDAGYHPAALTDPSLRRRSTTPA